VDLGLLHKPNPARYKYELLPRQVNFFERLVEADDPDEFCRRNLVKCLLEARGLTATPIAPEEIWPRIETSYETLRTGLGYTSLVEVVLLALGSLVNEHEGRYFEIQDGLDAVRVEQRRRPREIRYGVRRGGGLSYMRIVSAGTRSA